MDIHDNEDRLELERVYDEYRKECNVVRTKATENFERNLITLSAAMLTFSVAFMTKDREPNIWIYLAWFSLGLSVCTLLSTYFVVTRGLIWSLDQVEKEFFSGGPSHNLVDNSSHKWHMRLNLIAAASFVLGIIFSAIYIGRYDGKEGFKTEKSEKIKQTCCKEGSTKNFCNEEIDASTATEETTKKVTKMGKDLKKHSLQPVPPKKPTGTMSKPVETPNIPKPAK